MRILHITSHLNVGGVASSTISLSKGLGQRGHRVMIASGGGHLEAQASAHGLTHWTFPLHTSIEFSPQVFSASRQLAARLRQDPIDIIHAHTRVGQVVAARLARSLRIPYVTTWHGFFRPNLGRRWWPCTGDLTIAISEPVRQHLLCDVGVPPQRVRLIPHGIDTSLFESPIDPLVQQGLRDQVHLLPHGPVVGTVARLVASKGVDQLIRSLPQLRALVPDVHLLIVGDGEDRPRLERLAVAGGVGEAVHFAGTLPETRAALSLMRVFVFLPAEQEGFGLSLLEAMASGCPIVAVRRGGGASWVLEESGIGVWVEPGDVNGLAAAAAQFLQDGEAASRAAGQVRAVVKDRYTLSRMVDEVEAVYHEAVSNTSSAVQRPSG
jgi:glycosyltransferase involved in cell wall biosynthesis